MKVKLYIEGGGDRNSLHIKCREGFRKLLERAGFRGRMPSTKACGTRDDAFDDFKTAMSAATERDYPVLLVDSEAPVSGLPWSHLQERDGWAKPEGADEDQAQLMVQCMETWCVADRETLQSFFREGFHPQRLPANVELEAAPKDDIQDGLAAATRDCGRDKVYRKGARSFQLLAQLDPRRLRQRLPHFDRLCEMLKEKL